MTEQIHVAGRMGRLPVITGNAFGFIGKRVYSACRRHCEFLLEEGVAQRPGDVDVVLVNGLGFPRREGGAVCSARKHDRKALGNDIDRLASLSGPGFGRGDLAFLLEEKD